MKAIQFQEFGPPENLQYVTLPDPAEPTGSQVLVRTQAVGVNFHDHRTRLGQSTGALAPGIPGLELSGLVIAVGPEVTTMKSGDRVFGRARKSYAELVLVEEGDLFFVPEGVTFAQAAVMPVAFLTASHALLSKSDLKAGMRLLVQAGASSVGSAALQIARWKGVWTAATSSSDAKLERLKSDVGLQLGVNYETGNTIEAVKAATDGEGVDIVMDGVGKSTINGSIGSCKRGGKVMIYGAASGSETLTFDASSVINPGLWIQGFSITQDREIFRNQTMPQMREVVLPLFTSGDLRPMLEETIPLADAVRAHKRIVDRGVYGKIALIPEGAGD